MHLELEQKIQVSTMYLVCSWIDNANLAEQFVPIDETYFIMIVISC